MGSDNLRFNVEEQHVAQCQGNQILEGGIRWNICAICVLNIMHIMAVVTSVETLSDLYNKTQGKR